MAPLADARADAETGEALPPMSGEGSVAGTRMRPVRLSPSLIRSGAGFRLALAITLSVISIGAVALVTG